jgi:Protein of unknown function (DUF3168)
VTRVLAAFPDVERMLGDLLSDLGTVGSETNIDLQTRLPYIRVHRIGGVDNRITDAARVDIDVYTTDATAGKTLTETIRQRLISGPSATAHGVIDRAWVESGAQTAPTDDPNLRRVITTFRIAFRRR